MQNKIIIYHNPKCRKSREALNFLDEFKTKNNNKVEVQIYEYLKKGLNKEQILEIEKKLNLDICEILRKNEIEFKEFKKKNLNYDREDIINLLEKTPKIIERPIIIYEEKAIIGRDLEKLKDFLDEINK
jgi:arsenate reductase